MTEGLLPPFVEPEGVPSSDEETLAAYVGGLQLRYSARFHVDGPALVVGREATAALRVGNGTVLVRTDPPEGLAWARPDVESALVAAGYQLLDEETLWATPVALQVLGLRLSSWDLWGRDIDAAFSDLRAAAVGEDDATVFGAGPVGGWT